MYSKTKRSCQWRILLLCTRFAGSGKRLQGLWNVFRCILEAVYSILSQCLQSPACLPKTSLCHWLWIHDRKDFGLFFKETICSPVKQLVFSSNPQFQSLMLFNTTQLFRNKRATKLVNGKVCVLWLGETAKKRRSILQNRSLWDKTFLPTSLCYKLFSCIFANKRPVSCERVQTERSNYGAPITTGQQSLSGQNGQISTSVKPVLCYWAFDCYMKPWSKEGTRFTLF